MLKWKNDWWSDLGLDWGSVRTKKVQVAFRVFYKDNKKVTGTCKTWNSGVRWHRFGDWWREREKNKKKRSERVAAMETAPPNEWGTRWRVRTEIDEMRRNTNRRPPRSHFSLFVVCLWCWNRLSLGLESLDYCLSIFPRLKLSSFGRRTNDISSIDGRVKWIHFLGHWVLLCSMWSGWLGALAIASPSWSKFSTLAST